MKKLYWKISLVLLTLFLLVPYAGEFGNLKVKADETQQTENPVTSDNQGSEVKNSGQETPASNAFTGTLNDMIDQVYPAIPTTTKPSSKSFVNDDGVTINGKFYSNAEFDALLDKMILAPNAPDFTVDASGHIRFDYDLRILPLAAPIFVAALPIIGKVFVTGAAIVVAGLTINESNKEYNKITSRLNAAQKAKVEAEKAKAKAKKTSKRTPKERADDAPSWAKGGKIKSGENADSATKRIMDKKFGKGKWNGNTAGGAYSKIKKYLQRGGR